VAVVVFWTRIGQPGWSDRLAYAGSGLLVGYLCLVPVHEAIHGIAYRVCGATTVRIHIRWRTLSAYCTADEFATSGDQFLFVCLAPCAVISPLILLAGAFLPKLAPLLGGMLLLHTGACSGDFGMVALALQHKLTAIWIYDRNRENKTYIWEVPDSAQSA
jgi:Putative zincin peptidase